MGQLKPYRRRRIVFQRHDAVCTWENWWGSWTLKKIERGNWLLKLLGIIYHGAVLPHLPLHTYPTFMWDITYRHIYVHDVGELSIYEHVPYSGPYNGAAEAPRSIRCADLQASFNRSE